MWPDNSDNFVRETQKDVKIAQQEKRNTRFAIVLFLLLGLAFAIFGPMLPI